MPGTETTEGMIALTKARMYRFDDNLVAHIKIEELERHWLVTRGLQDDGAAFLRAYLEAWRQGTAAPEWPEALAVSDMEMGLLKRLQTDEAVVSLPEITRPIFIVGSPRSGSSFLFNLLTHNPSVAYFSTISHFLWPIHNFRRETRKLWYQCSEAELEKDSKSLRLRADIVIPSEGEQILNRSISVYRHIRAHEYCLHAATEFDADMLKRCIRKHLWIFRAPRFICKSPFNSFRLRQLNAMFPDAQFIHIVRNGYDVSDSIVENGFRYSGAECDGSSDGAWQGHIRAVLRDAPRDRTVVVRFEDLIGDYPQTFTSLLQVLGIDVQPPAIDCRPRVGLRMGAATRRRRESLDSLNLVFGYDGRRS